MQLTPTRKKPVLIAVHCLLTAMAWSPSAQAAPATAAVEPSNLQVLEDKGQYWLARNRYDLASQMFNKMLLVDPDNAAALRWQGLVELRKGEVQAAGIWAKRLQGLVGANHPLALELNQAIELAGNKRQAFAELKYLANSERVPADLPTRLQGLLDKPPVGEAALQIYGQMARTPEGRALARQRLNSLSLQFPNDQRYRAALAELGGGGAAVAANPAATPSSRATAKPGALPVNKANGGDAPGELAAGNTVVAPVNTLGNFEQGQQLSDQAQQARQQGDLASAMALLKKAISLNPDYAWFRFELAGLQNDLETREGRIAAQQTMQDGLAIKADPDMRFASALIAARQNRNTDALTLLEPIAPADRTDGMNALVQRIQLGEFRAQMASLEDAGRYNDLATLLSQPNPWRAEPTVFAKQEELQERLRPRVRMGYEDSAIDGSPGVSGIRSTEVPIQVDLPLDFEKRLFVRLDQLQAKAGQVDVPNATNFAQLGTTVANDPAIQSRFLTQNYRGQVLGVGLQTDTWRVDLGSTAGDLPVNSWVGGLQWKTPVGDNGSLRLDIARRMVGGSVLSSTGAIDPLTGQRWGAARRNGVSAVYYTPLSPTVDFVGIGKANLITGEHMPDNTELNLQGILSKAVYQNQGQKVEVGASLYLWSFQKNLRFYTYGQGGYYSPQAFGSFTIPVTWTGRRNHWSWRLQASIGASESKEDATDLYPLDPQLAAAAAARGNATRDAGGPGGGTSTGLRAQIEHRLMRNLVVGALLEIDRSEGYNPDRAQVYLKYSFGGLFDLSVPPEGITPYSRF
ncbi:cellulose synthase subunit BcsC-related outer membrane protein [Limnobacter humi]|uniref:Cellulose synthase subunit BcsC-related outer membrane protein n=1 Tax=Limnobacter humi TaxID=1778671 RepID=A0ABT1WF84_9BURK|nr:cellulose synthase subunit BcsC-related outer membrane protein [Limnobacter humi]MCQ8895417.1 cellulose synthase subunit BcsC-related outer membrane protein [Limnobacter humi]